MTQQGQGEVEQFIKACHPCQQIGPRSKAEPIRSTTLPGASWDDIALDLLEIPEGNRLLVVVDNYSRWNEVILLTKTEAANVTKAKEGMFHTYGLPLTIRSDNGPPFSSVQFEGFLDHLGIVHKKGTVYWPQSNSKFERCNETILKIVRIALLIPHHTPHGDWIATGRAIDGKLTQ